MTALEKQLKEDLKKVLVEGKDDPCFFCKHHFHGCNENCKHYEKGNGLLDEKNNYYDWNWTCMDWEYGTCEQLINTPCHKCFENDFSNWEYNEQREV